MRTELFEVILSDQFVFGGSTGRQASEYDYVFLIYIKFIHLAKAYGEMNSTALLFALTSGKWRDLRNIPRWHCRFFANLTAHFPFLITGDLSP